MINNWATKNTAKVSAKFGKDYETELQKFCSLHCDSGLSPDQQTLWDEGWSEGLRELHWKAEKQRLFRQIKKRKFHVIYQLAFQLGYDSEFSTNPDPECPYKKGDKENIWLFGFESGQLQAQCDIDKGSEW